jgi:hypothetical protein
VRFDRFGQPYHVAMPDGARHTQVHLDTHPHDQYPFPDLAEMTELAFEAFGVGIAIVARPDVLSRVRMVLPPGSREKEPAPDDEHFFVQLQENKVYRVWQGGDGISGSADLHVALEVLDSRLRAHIALHAPDHIFIHAGVVGYEGRAIVVPGKSFSGKTTLVAELVRAGATYYSDEFAALDDAGLVHPYPKPLSMRSGGLSQVDHAVEAIGGVAGAEPLPVGLVVVTIYSPEANWDPRRLSSGEAVLAVLANTVPAQTRPEQAMSSIRKAVQGAVVLEGERGDAAALAPKLIAGLTDQPQPA